MRTVPMSWARWLAPALLACLPACGGGGSSPEDTGGVSLTGAWSGPIQVTLNGSPVNVQFDALMSQSGNAITGTVTLTQAGDTAEPSNLTGEVLGNQATLIATAMQVPEDDCHLYPITLVFAVVSQNVMTLTSASGDACNGNGSGGHVVPLETVGGGSGDVTRQ